MENKDLESEKYKSRTERKIQRNKDTIKEYENNKDNLSIHGHWSLGYYVGLNNELQNRLEDINELLKEIDLKIQNYKSRIEKRNGNNYHDESERIRNFEDEIYALEISKEYILKLS